MPPLVVQKNSSQNTGSSSEAVTLAGVVGGNALIAVIIAGNLSNLTSVTDDKGNTYSLVVQSIAVAGAEVAIYIANNVTGGSVTITAAFSSGTGIGIGLYEASGLASWPPDDGTNTSSNAGNVVTDSATLVTTADNDLVIGITGIVGSGGTITIAAPYTTGFTSTDGVRAFGSGYNVVSPAGSTTFETDWTNTTNDDLAMAAFKASGGGATTVDKTHNIDADIQFLQSKVHNIDAFILIPPPTDKIHNIDAYIFIPPQTSKVHNIDAFILVTALRSFVRLAGNIYPQIDPIQGYVRFRSTLAAQQLSFVKLNALIKASVVGYVDLAGTIQVITRNYVKLAGTISSDKLKTHNIDAAIAVNELSYVQIFGTIVAKIEPGPCMSFPDASYVKLAAWMVIPGDSEQMPNSGFSLADDFLSSQTALQAYKPMSLISLAGFNLIVTAFTAGVYSWQTRARTWLTRQDEAGSGILLTTTVNTHTLPNGAVITTTTQVKLVQDVQVTIVTIQNSATPERTSVIVTEKNQFGQTVTRESDTTNINGTINTLTKRTVYTQPPTNDNIQPITVRTLDGVQHYQFFSQQNTEWAGGDAEGVTQTQTQQQIIPSSLNGKTQDQFGNPILARINDTIENDPTGKLIHTHTEEIGIRDVGTTTTDTQDSFNGITETTIVTTTYPDGSQEVRKSVKNSITGDTTEISTETVTDEYGQITTTVTNTETKTFVDPISGVLRTLITKTVNVTKSGVNTVDTTVVSTDNFEDSIVNDKIKVISIQEFTIACVLDEFTMFGLWEINESHQKQYALQELFGQQLGNANLTYALRQRLIKQFNAANCVPCVNLQANGRTWCVVFAPSASAFRPKLIMGTEPHVYELQLIVQARSNLIDGTTGF